jgi:2-polyprenyl-3-methyl-5-hydroxy-6-metoxy-1,4-benzoquinol methylase
VRVSNLEKFISRENCVICGSKELKPKIVLYDMPIYMGVSNYPADEDKFFEQNWAECVSCGCIQLKKLIPLNLLYSHSHNSVIGKIWHNHHLEFMKFVLEAKPDNILEIGAGDGYLANLILMNREMNYTIIEPNPHFNNDKVNLIEDIVENNFHEVFKSDTIIHSHVLEHLYDPLTFLNDLSENLKEGAKLIFSIPNIPRLISLQGGNALNFEHTYMLDIRQIEIIMESLGFQLISKATFQEHSYFYSYIKTQKNKNLDFVIPNISDSSKDFQIMFKKLDKFVQDINRNLKMGDNNYIFGAHVFTQILFNRGLDPLLFKAVLDNSEDKIGKRLYGTDLMVQSPIVLTSINKGKVVLKATHYQDEIKEQIEKINSSILILE